MIGKKGGVARHLQGWEAGLVAILIALVGTLLAVPLPVAPRDVPLPLVDGQALAATLEREQQLEEALVPALRHEQEEPSEGTELYDLRAFGQKLRAYGLAEVSGDTYELVRARRQLVSSAAQADALGEDKMLGLRAYQLHLFLTEVRRWEDSGRQSEELSGLGGPFISLVSRQGWTQGRAILMDDVVRGIFWKRRWNEITGLTRAPYTPSLDESRAFYAFLLAHPLVEGTPDEKDACRLMDQWRLRKVQELAQLDPAYPYELARGVLDYRLARYPAAVQAFTDFLTGSSDGSYALRARNYLAAATARAKDEP